MLKCGTDSFKTASKRAIQKIEEATSDLIGNLNCCKITKVSKTVKSETENVQFVREILTEIYISSEKKQQIIDEITLI